MTKKYTTYIDFTSFIENNYKELSILKNNLDKTKSNSLDNFEKQFIYKQIVLHCFVLIESSFRHALIEAVISNEMSLKHECSILIDNAPNKDKKVLIDKIIYNFGNIDTLKEAFIEKTPKYPFADIIYVKNKFKKYSLNFIFTGNYIKEFADLKTIRNLIVHSNTVNRDRDVINSLDEKDVQKYLNITDETLQGLAINKL